MRPFNLLEPENLAEACSMLSKYGDKARVIAGGQSLLPMLKHRVIAPKYLINLKALSDLEYICQETDSLRIGALTTHRTIETSPLIRKLFPVLTEMERTVGSAPVRNWGTIGGSLCHADPGGDAGTVLMALGARLKLVRAKSERHVDLNGFFTGYLETVLEPDEILAEIELPNPALSSGAAYIKESVRLGDYAIAAAAAWVTVRNITIQEARLVLGAVGSTPTRATLAEKILVGKPIDADFQEAAEMAAREANPKTDVEGSEEYKRHIVKYITREAIRRALKQAKAN